MKKSTAAQHLRTFMAALQKYRSNALDPRSSVGLSEDLLATMYPWVFGEKCPLVQLSRVLDRLDREGVLEVQDYYNFRTILYKFMPEIIACSKIIGQLLPEDPPSVTVLSGWDQED